MLLGSVVQKLQACDAVDITINIADLNETLRKDASRRLIGPWESVSAVVSLWHENLDHRFAIEEILDKHSESITGYLVTESVVQPFEHDWEDGERRPGITQFGANGKPEGVSDEQFYHNWQTLHSAQSFELHPLRWSYVRNAVARPLTPDAPTYRAIVMEHFHSLQDFCDDSRYYGSQEAIQETNEHLPSFFDMENMFSLGMSEYHFS